jgi:hypothetical protein
MTKSSMLLTAAVVFCSASAYAQSATPIEGNPPAIQPSPRRTSGRRQCRKGSPTNVKCGCWRSFPRNSKPGPSARINAGARTTRALMLSRSSGRIAATNSFGRQVSSSPDAFLRSPSHK